jgi:DNA adenine methylase/adenine-specific DNA-methyltransferase
MGSKHRLLPWIHAVLSEFRFDTALDAFSGSGCVAYLLKCMGKQVAANDLLNLGATVARATVENSRDRLDSRTIERLLSYDPRHRRFIERTYRGIFYTPADLRFLDLLCWNIAKMRNPYRQAVARAAVIRACVKRQPRGVFTVAGDPARYKDKRRDLRLSLRDHFLEQVHEYNRVVFDNGRQNRAIKGDVFDVDPRGFDLVYMDPPYVPRADDNCYVKRYHFLEGLSCYWEGLRILEDTKVKKIEKPFTPFSYRSRAVAAFDRLFAKFRESILVLSYSSNGFPDLGVLVDLMRGYKKRVEVFETRHRYHFGTHDAVDGCRTSVREYLIVGRGAA